MKKILIADSNKASLVMTSEIFKDHYPGVQIYTAHTSKDALQTIREQKNFDIFIVDLNLPDLNGIHTASKIKKMSKTPLFITLFEGEKLLSAQETQFLQNENNFLLKKPLQSDVVRSVCELYHKSNIKFQKTVSVQLSAFACLIGSKKSSLKEKNSYVSILIQECSLNKIRFKINLTSKSDAQNKIITSFQNLNMEDKILLKLQNPEDIELGKIVTSENILNLKQSELLKLFPFEMIGKIITHPEEVKDNPNKDFWVEFENISLAKRIFEAVLREKINEQFKIPYIKWSSI